MQGNLLLVACASFGVLRIGSAKYDSFRQQRRIEQEEEERKQRQKVQEQQEWEQEQRRWKEQTDQARDEAYKNRQEANRAKNEAERAKEEARRAREEARRQQEDARKQKQQRDFDVRINKDENYYANVLGLDKNATPEKIKERYRYLATKYHPDKVNHLGDKLKETAEREMKLINEAFDYYRRIHGF